MADLAAQKARPQYRNIHVSQLLSYRLPPAGIVSILHRISGALLFLVGIPFVLFLLQQSLTSEISFESYRAVVGSIPGKLVLLVLIWAFVHHAVAGIRYLLLDRHVGIQKESSRTSAVAVLGITGVLTVVLALKLFGAF
ncbi:MAG: succinate dehydrogenase, cytochrome b556 subunit [Burkholderiaceae bacterium]|jgi:succinate dehydrogenase / fumarate reductase, cytochrome b subunit